MPIVHQDLWEEWVKNNSNDGYSNCCVKVAEEVMRVLDNEDIGDKNTWKLICEADKNIKAGGITGFMAGAVVTMIFSVHSKGPEIARSQADDLPVNDPKAANKKYISKQKKAYKEWKAKKK